MNWVPPAIYKSSCYIDVKFFPFGKKNSIADSTMIKFVFEYFLLEFFLPDQQTCELRFGSWTYDQRQMNFSYYDDAERRVTIKDYVVSGSWDLMDGPMSIQQSTPNITISDTSNESSNSYISVIKTRLEKADGRDRVEFVCTLVIRRKTLFYTVNLIIPTVNRC